MRFVITCMVLGTLVACQCNKEAKSSFLNYTSEKLDSTAIIGYSEMAVKMKWTGAMVSDPDYTIWGASPIEGPDGKIHVFAARWKEIKIRPAWYKTCEIAHYVADHPEGEYKYLETVATGSGIEGAWDRYAPHNPEIKKIGDYYALIYIANTDYNKPPFPANQRIGLLYSKSLNGPWVKAGKDGLIIDVPSEPNHWTYDFRMKGSDNPSITIVGDKIIAYYKVTKLLEDGSIVSVYTYASSDKIEGPYTISEKPLMENNCYIEDATSFSYKNKHYLLTCDNNHDVSGLVTGGVLWESTDGVSFSHDKVSIGWRPVKQHYKEYDSEIANYIHPPYESKFERPKVLMQNNQPSYFFAPSKTNVYGDERMGCYILKIDQLEN
ncbi:MAG: glycoside hydrolase family protein [Carboxylicivirga sp.]|nr:glycoside hydrolase family protein [Carboxylicivirga sp.]